MVHIPVTTVFSGAWALSSAYFMPNSALWAQRLRYTAALVPIEDFEGKT
jgi:hypothetical protein